METIVNCESSYHQDLVVPRLTFNRAFSTPGEQSSYADYRDTVLNYLNNSIERNPDGILDDISWLEDQLAGGTPIETRPFVAIKDGLPDDGWSLQRPYIGIIRDVLSITSNGSQFEFGHTPEEREANWAIIFDKCKEIDPHEISLAQSRVQETQTMLRRARSAEAKNEPNAEAEVGRWERLNTIAKQQRALTRLRSLAIMSRGPELEIPVQATSEPDVVEAAPRELMRAPGVIARASSWLLRTTASANFF